MDFLKEREDYKEGESREMIFLKEWEDKEEREKVGRRFF